MSATKAEQPRPVHRRRDSSVAVDEARRTSFIAVGQEHGTVALRIAQTMGLLSGPKTKHFNAKVSPKLFEAAAKRVGTTSPAAVINAALASLATEDELGSWLAKNWGVLADTPPDILDQIDL